MSFPILLRTDLCGAMWETGATRNSPQWQPANRQHQQHCHQETSFRSEVLEGTDRTTPFDRTGSPLFSWQFQGHQAKKQRTEHAVMAYPALTSPPSPPPI